MAKFAWKSTIRWAAETFGPILVFYTCEHALGLLAAIIAGIVTGVVIVALQIIRDKKVSPFTAFIALSVLVFGGLDLRYQTGFFVKLEPALGNAVWGAFFVGSALIGRPIIVELVRQAGRNVPARALRYLGQLTIAWGLFFFVRAAALVWMAYHVSLDADLSVRATIMPASFGAMFVLEMAYRYLRFGKKAFGRGTSTPEAAASTPADAATLETAALEPATTQEA